MRQDEDLQRFLAFLTVAFVSLLLLFFAYTIISIVFRTPGPDITCPVFVENGTLHTMDMDYSNSTLTYSLSAVFSFPSTFAKFATVLSYGGEQLGPESSLQTFQEWYLERRMMVPIDVWGQQAAGAVVARTYADDATRGYYTTQVKLRMRILGIVNWCESSCTLYFFVTSPGPRGAPNIFDGDDCSTTCFLKDQCVP